ncbi:MAG: D-alanyl-D-alanine carboxypeptidase [Oscillospiraceae bacterium]|jgi:D-alanyl-D-alanine carboxypeptidase (penicillin-binding protein 5/6)|nr:D-alanyl-D-alanine carboxypeptidase [Oscillospiraceae bacterium]
MRFLNFFGFASKFFFARSPRGVAAALLLTFLTFGLASPRTYAVTEPLTIDAPAVVLLDNATGEIFYADNEFTRSDPASLVKLMTAILAAEAVERGATSYDAPVTASDTFMHDVTWDATSIGIVTGETLPLEELLYATLVASASEASNVIAEHLAGTTELFVELMNAKAEQLGCVDTQFANSHGLPNSKQYSSAYDMALISREFLSHSTLARIANTVKHTVPETNKHKERTFTTTNYLLRETHTRYYYKYAVGLKTGSTGAAGFCLASSAERNGIHVVGVILGAKAVETEEKDVFEIQSFIEMKKLFNWFFDNYEYRTLLNPTELIQSIKVNQASGTDSVVIRPESGLGSILPKDTEIEDITRRITVFSEAEGAAALSAPIERGQLLGEISLEYNGKIFGPVPLIANTDVERSETAYFFAQAKAALNQTWIKLTIVFAVVLIGLYAWFSIRRASIRAKRRKARKAVDLESVRWNGSDGE